MTSHYFWDNNYGARIVCENLGYGTGATSKRRNNNNRQDFDTETGYRRCSSGNTNIMQCRKHGGPNQNDKSAQAYVRCSGKPWKPTIGKKGSEFYITGGEGWVERRSSRDRIWRPMTSHYFWDNKYGAEIVCRHLGFGKGTTSKRRNNGNRENFDSQTGYRRCHSSA
jgi:hypothetical protein